MAFPRLRDSQPHERSLNKEFASMHRGEYLIEEGLLLVRIMMSEQYYCGDAFIRSISYVIPWAHVFEVTDHDSCG
jgi:hypothetical protein